MLSKIIVDIILSGCILVCYIESAIVEFDSPELFRTNVPYKLKIINQNPGEKFPVDNFVFAFELLKSVSPREVISVAVVESPTDIEDDYHGFSIKEFKINTIKEIVEMNIEFRKDAHDTWFQIRYSSVKSDTDRDSFHNKNTDIGIIFKRYIKMLLPYKITFQVGPETREVNADDRNAVGHVLLPDKNGQLTCLASEGLPNAMPEFINTYELIGATINIVNNDATQLVWMVRVQDHNKQIICRAGQDFKNVTLSVYHYMTEVLSLPDIENKLPRGSQIKCINKDGYPNPRTYWVFVSGPQQSHLYYEFKDSNSTLFINSTTPVNSNWTFECRGSMVMPSVVITYFKDAPPTYPIKRQYSFIITGVDESVNNVAQSSSTGTIVVLSLLIIIIICGSIAGIIFKEKILKFITDKRPRNGALPNAPEKPLNSVCKYSEVDKVNSQVNGTEKEDATCYLEIVGTVQPKSLGPIHRV